MECVLKFINALVFIRVNTYFLGQVFILKIKRKIYDLGVEYQPGDKEIRPGARSPELW